MQQALLGPLAIIDTESTGVDPKQARICQIAVIQIDEGEVSGEFSWLVNPRVPIPPEASAVHGITDEAVQGRPFWHEAWPAARRAIEGRTLVGYNLLGYDIPLIQEEIVRGWGHDDNSLFKKALDVLVWIRHCDRYVRGKGRHKLTTTCQRHGIEVRDAHDALGDCRMTWALAQRIIGQRSLEALLAAQARLKQQQDEDFAAFLRGRA